MINKNETISKKEQISGDNITEQLLSPKQLADKKILSLVQQWKERDRGRLKCYRIGRKILYSQKHLADYFDLCES
jgi:hypothetical protein